MMRANVIHKLFNRRALEDGDVVAIYDNDTACSYAELRSSANRLAHHFLTLDIKPGTPVGVCLPRSARLASAYLGVLKAGGLIIPMDPDLPPERLNWMVRHAGAPVVLTDRRSAGGLRCDAAILEAETLDEVLSKEPTNDPALSLPPDAAAYVLYTSGSTGEPKGVVGLHSATVNRLRWGWDAWPYRPGEVSAWKTSIAFIDSLSELLAPLLAGVPTVVVSRATLLDPPRFLNLLTERKVSRLTVVPTYLRELMAWMTINGVSLPHLQVCTSSGEALTKDVARRFFDRCPEATLLNLYGSTEVTGDVTSCALRSGDIDGSDGAVSIGRPIANASVHVLDDAQRQVEDGEIGELYVGGAVLARGYLHAPELTSERFFDTPDGRLFRTGDLSRRLPGGELEYLGRVDRQVKVRGVRVELGEVEASISRAPGIEHAAVVVEDGSLVAYVVGHGAAGVLDHLQLHLPPEMVPARVVHLEALPLTPSGKIDRSRLAEVTTEVEASGPRSDLERIVAQAWCEVLDNKSVGLETPFAAAGGDSLRVVRLAHDLTRKLGREVTAPQVLQRPTIRAFAAWVEGGAASVNRAAIIEKMKADAVLDPEWGKGALPTLPPDGPRHVLLTGATGFLGAHLLAELLESGVETVACLARAPLGRVPANLRRYGQWRDEYDGRVQEVAGDLSKPRLGMSVEDYARLSQDTGPTM